MENKELIKTMAENFATIAYREQIERIHMFVSGAIQNMLEFAYNKLDDIVEAHDSGDMEALDKLIEEWKQTKEEIIKNHAKNGQE